MKRIASILFALSLAVLFMAASAHAQMEARMTATVPFDFTVGNISLPAGQYEFLGVGSNVVQIINADRHSVYTLSTTSVQMNGGTDKSTVKFATVDGRHVLVQLWNDLSENGSAFRYERGLEESSIRANLDGKAIDRR
jgi:hypothetical protein